MDEIKIKLECLRIAVASPGQDKVALAQSFYDFLTKSDTVTTGQEPQPTVTGLLNDGEENNRYAD